ncbi:hypothetical protein [Novipirellula rosea]|uniref:hypothetical protein n=1 Tax=Novipirellula rosea TaxID=1031540 RepID=UPI0031F0DEC9
MAKKSHRGPVCAPNRERVVGQKMIDNSIHASNPPPEATVPPYFKVLLIDKTTR